MSFLNWQRAALASDGGNDSCEDGDEYKKKEQEKKMQCTIRSITIDENWKS